MKDGSGCMCSDSQAPVAFENTITMLKWNKMSAKKASYLSFAILKYANSEWEIGSVLTPEQNTEPNKKRAQQICFGK